VIGHRDLRLPVTRPEQQPAARMAGFGKMRGEDEVYIFAFM
jgi:hypothetical protein